MGKLKAKDTVLLNYPVDYVYRVVTDIAAYHQWWPHEIKFELEYLDPAVIGTTINIQNGALVKWRSKITGFKINKLLAIDYIDGAWTGKTQWRFEDSGSGTLLTMEIDLEPNKLWLSVVAKAVNLGKRHSRQMKKIFQNLDKYLAVKASAYKETSGKNSVKISHIDHIVLTVSDIERTCAFYHDILGMEIVTFAEGRKALKFGKQKINLHEAGREFEPKAKQPVPGSADVCFITERKIDDVAVILQKKNIEIIAGQEARTGAMGNLRSVYFRDPDGNLVELAEYIK